MSLIINIRSFTQRKSQLRWILFIILISLCALISNCTQQQINQRIINDHIQSEGIRDTQINNRLMGQKIAKQNQQAEKNKILNQKQQQKIQSQKQYGKQQEEKINNQQDQEGNLQNNILQNVHENQSEIQDVNEKQVTVEQQKSINLKHKLKYVFRTLFKFNFTIPLIENIVQQYIETNEKQNEQEQQRDIKQNDTSQQGQIIIYKQKEQQNTFANQEKVIQQIQQTSQMQQIQQVQQKQQRKQTQQIEQNIQQKQQQQKIKEYQKQYKTNQQIQNKSNNEKKSNNIKINKTNKQNQILINTNTSTNLTTMNTTHFLNIIFNKTLQKHSTTYNVNRIIKTHSNSLLSKLLVILTTFIVNITPQSISETTQIILNKFIDFSIRQGIPIIKSYYQLYRILKQTPKYKPKKVYYQNNYANLYGGAKIIMKSSPKIKSINAILQDGPDKYMYTDQIMPLKIIIGLNQEIAIESIIIQSYQMYSCITKQFKVQGKFTMEDKKWVHLGTFKAENIFGDQQFYTQRKIVRYVKLTIFSSYGKWSYFTLTQVKIKGKNLFADALTDKNSLNKQKREIDQENVESQSHKDEQDRPVNICPKNTFQPPSQQPHQNNLIASLITKIDKLQAKNTGKSKQLEAIQSKFIQLSQLLTNKTQQNLIYKQLLEQYKSSSNINFYVIMVSVGLSFVTLFSLVCLCLIRRRQLAELKKSMKGALKKANSFD